ncbi:MAG TPA: hypothetical protein PLB55_01910 [Prosthecobacter sp.]|nr:hypothetical protein [Prosthecobacter sp.]
MSTDLQTHRGRVFFWIGLAVLPVFWIWWMSERYFSIRQIRTARLWTTVYLAALAGAWFAFPVLRFRVSDLRWTYSLVAFQVGIALWIWLIFRTASIREIIIGFIVCIDIIAILSSLTIPYLQTMAPHPGSIIFILIPAVAHLLVDPARRLRQRLISRRNE